MPIAFSEALFDNAGKAEKDRFVQFLLEGKEKVDFKMDSFMREF